MGVRIASAWLASCAFLLNPSLACAEDASVAGAKAARSVAFDCAGSASDDSSPPSFVTGGQMKFQVSATFGEGAILALVNPETNEVLKPLYDAETTSGHLRFSDGEETTIFWTRMSGIDGVLVGEAIMSDGDVLALTIKQSFGATQRPFALFAAAAASLFRGTCTAVVDR